MCGRVVRWSEKKQFEKVYGQIADPGNLFDVGDKDMTPRSRVVVLKKRSDGVLETNLLSWGFTGEWLNGRIIYNSRIESFPAT